LAKVYSSILRNEFATLNFYTYFLYQRYEMVF